MLPLLAGMGAMNAAGGLLKYMQGQKEADDAKRKAKKQAIAGMYGAMAGPYGAMIPQKLDTPEGPSAFEAIAMPVGQAVIQGLGKEAGGLDENGDGKISPEEKEKDSQRGKSPEENAY